MVIGIVLIAAYLALIFAVVGWEPHDDGRWR